MPGHKTRHIGVQKSRKAERKKSTNRRDYKHVHARIQGPLFEALYRLSACAPFASLNRILRMLSITSTLRREFDKFIYSTCAIPPPLFVLPLLLPLNLRVALFIRGNAIEIIKK